MRTVYKLLSEKYPSYSHTPYNLKYNELYEEMLHSVFFAIFICITDLHQLREEIFFMLDFEHLDLWQ